MKNTVTFLGGLGLIALGVADAAFNPFAFATMPQFITGGIGMIGLSLGIKDDKKRSDDD